MTKSVAIRRMKRATLHAQDIISLRRNEREAYKLPKETREQKESFDDESGIRTHALSDYGIMNP